MILINRNQTTPFFNIAAEEYVLKHYSENVMMLWQSEPSVVVGKHQNTVAEVNLSYIRKKGIPVIRRVSGGGTVYHDLGNINYTVIKTEENRERLIDFAEFSKPIVEFLKTYGVEAIPEGKNNLAVNGKKISGNSAHVFKNRVVHHGTVLFSTNLDELEKVIKPPKAYISDRAVKSIRATVTNLSVELGLDWSLNDFKEKLTVFLMNYHHIENVHHFTENDIDAINTLVLKKYKTADWNYGYSPAYTFENRVGDNNLTLKVKNGIIESLGLEINGAVDADLFLGVMHRYDDILKIIEKLNLDAEQQQMLLSLFGV